MFWQESLTTRFLARRPACRWALLAVAGLAVGTLTSDRTACADDQAEPSNPAISDQIEAGEFGSALNGALSAKDPGEQTQMLQQIAGAQAAAGDADAASATLRRIPNPRVRSQAVNRSQVMRGGGANWQPMQLIMLIRQNTGDRDSWAQGQGDDEGGTISQFQQGVRVSPQGLLERVTTQEQSRDLVRLGIRARKAEFNHDLARSSALRLVSLTRLDQALTEHLAAGHSVPTSMALLAGLTKVQYVFVFPDSGEIVIGGPAEGWEYNSLGQAVGASSRAPTLQLDDLVTVLRTFAAGTADFGCSINTRDENVKSLMQYVSASQSQGALDAGPAVKGFVNQIQQKIGRQDIVVWGVPADSRVARVIIDADYRMKLIGVDKLDAGKDIPSYFDLLPQDLQKHPAPMEALRWWLTMKYDAVLHNADKSVFEIQGSSVLCQSENQMLTAEGKNVPTGKSEGVNRMFAENFTANYEKLSERDLVFADARNIFDLALVAGLIYKEQLLQAAGGDFQAFAAGGLYHPTTYAVASEVESVVNHRVYKGKDIVVQAAGGVRASVRDVIHGSDQMKTAPELDQVAAAAKSPQIPANRWWWDVAK